MAHTGSDEHREDGPARGANGGAGGPGAAPDSLWVRCSNCRELIYRKLFDQSLKICPHCGYHYRLTANERVAHLFDAGTFEEVDAELVGSDVIGFSSASESYEQTLARNRERAGRLEACLYGTGKIRGHEVCAVVFDFAFMGGSMGTVVGEKVVRAFELALERDLPVVAVTASGGARMQEGMYSLFQMARTTLAASRFRRESRHPFVCVMTNPTTGGVLASFASRADVILAEPGALIGFAGPRVIERTVRAKLPKGFQTAEFLHERGLVDAVVRRDQLPTRIARVLAVFER